MYFACNFNVPLPRELYSIRTNYRCGNHFRMHCNTLFHKKNNHYTLVLGVQRKQIEENTLDLLYVQYTVKLTNTPIKFKMNQCKQYI